MVPCDAEYRLKAGDQVFVSAPRLGPKLRYPTHWALGGWVGAGQLGGWAGRWNQLRQTFAPDTHQSRSRSLEPEQ